MKNRKNLFREGVKVKVSSCYLEDECTEHMNTSETAVVLQEPSDPEELVMIQYESEEIDFVPQDILEILIDWKDEILENHKGQTGFFKKKGDQIEKMQMTICMLSLIDKTLLNVGIEGVNFNHN